MAGEGEGKCRAVTGVGGGEEPGEAVGRCWSESISRRRRRSAEVTARADAGAGEGVDTGIVAKAGAGERAFVEGEVT